MIIDVRAFLNAEMLTKTRLACVATRYHDGIVFQPDSPDSDSNAR
jgi:hypothetical protein